MMSLVAQSLSPQSHHKMNFNLSPCSDQSSNYCFSSQETKGFMGKYTWNPLSARPKAREGTPKTSRRQAGNPKELGFHRGEQWVYQSPCSNVRMCKRQCQSLSRVQLFATLWTVAPQVPLSMEFSRQEYWSG